MASTELAKRGEMMDNTVFERQNLEFLNKGFQCLLPLWIDVAEAKNRGEVTARKDILDKLNNVTRSHWEHIEAIFLKDPYHSYSMGQFSSQDEQTPSKLVMDLINTLSTLHSDMVHKMETYYNVEEELRAEIEKMQGELTKVQQDLLDVRWQYNRAKTELTAIHSTVTHLEQLNQEKTERIAQLQRDGTVQLWEKEKKKAMEKAGMREEELEIKIKNLENERNALIEKVNDIDGQLKMEKLKNELKLNQTNSFNGGEQTQKLKAQCFVLEKDLLKIDHELHAQQKYTIGLFNGLKEDFGSTFAKYRDREKPKALDDNAVVQIDRLESLLVKFHKCAREGRLGILRAELPERYIGTDKDVVAVPVRKISTGYGLSGRLSPLPKRKQFKSTEDLKNSDDDDSESDSEAADKVNGLKRNSLHPPSNQPRRQSVKPGHPMFVNPDNNFIDMIAVMKKFPHMTRDYVKEQWEQFCKYDTSGDYNLDLTEMMNAMMTTVGDKFTATQIRETMLEVDIDGSDDIDFYEYLTVANMLSNKHGKSEVFRSKLIQTQGRTVSKTCVVM